jgi:hypothetical protein
LHQAPGTFWVIDLTAAGEVRLRQEYDYRSLEQLDGAIGLISAFSSHLWRAPEGFDLPLPGGRLNLRLRPAAETCALATLREIEDDQLLSLSILLAGQQPDADTATLSALQHHLFRELHDTGHEPAFDLLHLRDRPLVATLNLRAPQHPADQSLFALTDRCLAASYFRKLGLA